MLLKKSLSKVAIAVALATSLSAVSLAQETSSSIRGVVQSESGQVASGATVTITDTRTNTTRTITASESGAFAVRGLRVGGPYVIVVEDELGSRTINDVYADLGTGANLTVSLVAPADVERISVVGIQSSVLTESLGPGSSFDLEDLRTQPSVDRDIKDLLQTDPRISIDPTNSNAVQCAGVNNRSNSLTVDGVQQNDNFGLNGNGYPTEGLPFPFDALDQVDVQLAPFDVTYGGFTGCNINAVTQSGTNEISGSFFYDYTNDAMQGSETADGEFDVPSFNEARYGFTIGAPIIKDKLFIFAAYEKHNPTQIFDNGPEGAGFANSIEGLTVDVLDEIKQIASSVYGYEAGDILTSADEKDEKLLVKLDWNINDNHRAAFTFQQTESATISASGTGSSSYAFNDRYYERANDLTSYALSVYSDWSADFFTEFRYSLAKVENGQVPFTSNPSFGSVEISNAVDGVDVFLGADVFRQANKLDYDTTAIKFAGTYFAGDHEITAGIEHEAVDIFNLFVPTSQGEFVFDGIENFTNQIADEINYSIPGSLDPNDGAAAFELSTTTLYVQDRWYINPELTLTFGLRYDMWGSSEDPTYNANFESRYGVSNAKGPDFDLLQPRVGFNYTPDEDTFVYGGLGLFAGGNPNVWLSNNYSNNGITILNSEANSDSTDPDELAALDGSNTTNFGIEVPQFLADALEGGDGAVNALDPKFEIPSIWKFNLGAQRDIGDGYVIGADVIYSKQVNAAKTIAINTVQVGTAADGRPIYQDVDLLGADCSASDNYANCSGRSGTDYYLTNADSDGHTFVFTTFASKEFDFGLNINAGYAYMDAEEGSPMNSSTASSNYGNLSVIDLAEPGIYTSNYEVKHRFTLNFAYKHNFYEDYDTRFNVFVTRQSGRPYSYNFDWDPGFGDERPWEDRNLLYVPLENDSIVAYEDDFDLDGFNELIESQGLKRGTILGRNTQNSDWWGRIDLRVSQELPGFMEGHSGEVFFVMRNLGNFINSDWGNYRQVNFEYNNNVVDATLLDDGTYLYDEFDGDQGQSINASASSWSMRVGVRYTF